MASGQVAPNVSLHPDDKPVRHFKPIGHLDKQDQLFVRVLYAFVADCQCVFNLPPIDDYYVCVYVCVGIITVLDSLKDNI